MPSSHPSLGVSVFFLFFLYTSLCGGGVPSSHPSLGLSALSAFFLCIHIPPLGCLFSFFYCTRPPARGAAHGRTPALGGSAVRQGKCLQHKVVGPATKGCNPRDSTRCMNLDSRRVYRVSTRERDREQRLKHAWSAGRGATDRDRCALDGRSRGASVPLPSPRSSAVG